MPTGVYPRPPSARVRLICQQCGDTYFRYPSEIRPTCSRACTLAFQGPIRRTDPEARFWKFVARTTDTMSCWPWTGGQKSEGGYGVFALRRNGKLQVGAHDYALELRLGRPLADGEFGLHTCDVKPCVRNDGEEQPYIVAGVEYRRFGHLYLGSHHANMIDMVNKGRSTAGSNSPHAKLTEAIVIATKASIRSRQENQREAARRLGVSQSLIQGIMAGDRWPHIP